MRAPFISTTRPLPRRTFLKGAGISLALPMLDAMLPSFARAATTDVQPPRRFVGMMTNMGILPQFFFPVDVLHQVGLVYDIYQVLGLGPHL